MEEHLESLKYLKRVEQYDMHRLFSARGLSSSASAYLNINNK